ncbi:DUF6128 domain-containing protein [Lachnospiraceae bacterium OttesenSCG-928-D06]|nr:DUF6128 domain-containing protein [Lachnospiraceae bacterium OttesenSCG-928-D06]
MVYDKKIKYFDYLENGVKVSNAGFVKIEARDKKCNIQINIRGLYKTDSFLKEVKIGDGEKEVLLTEIPFTEGIASLKMTNLPLEQMGDGEISYEELSEIRIPISKSREIVCVIADRKGEGEKSQEEKEVEKNGKMGTEEGGIRERKEVGEVKRDREVGRTEDAGGMKEEEGTKEEEGAKEEDERGSTDSTDRTVRTIRTENMDRVIEMEDIEKVDGIGSAEESVEESKISNKDVHEDNVNRNTYEPIMYMGKVEEVDFRNNRNTNQNINSEKKLKIVEIGKIKGIEKVERGREEGEKGIEKAEREIDEAESRIEKATKVEKGIEKTEKAKRTEKTEEIKIVKKQRETKPIEKQSPKSVSLYEDKWKQLSSIYPHIAPFQDEREYLSIGPHDFVVLSKVYHKMVNNSFLLHGFYNYEHLILARLMYRGEERFYLGVPGNYYEREKQVAVMFGFESFECKSEPSREGDFGYYMMRVEI